MAFDIQLTTSYCPTNCARTTALLSIVQSVIGTYRPSPIFKARRLHHLKVCPYLGTTIQDVLVVLSISSIMYYAFFHVLLYLGQGAQAVWMEWSGQPIIPLLYPGLSRRRSKHTILSRAISRNHNMSRNTRYLICASLMYLLFITHSRSLRPQKVTEFGPGPEQLVPHHQPATSYSPPR